MGIYNVALIQFAINDADTKEKRIEHAAELVDQAKDADFIMFPEAWNIGWWNWDKYETECETLDGPTVSMLAEKARQHNAYVHCGTIILKHEDGSLSNSAVLLDPAGKVIATYDKIHTVNWASLGAIEGAKCKSGTKLVTAQTDLGTIGLSICYDLRFPEVARQYAVKHNVDILTVAAAWATVRVDDWRCMLHARATENLQFVFACGCCGVNRGNTYAGFSQVLDPHGRIHGEAVIYEAIVRAQIDTEAVARTRKQIPAFDDRVLDVG